MRRVRLILRAELLGTMATTAGHQFEQLTEVPRTVRIPADALVEWLGDRLEEFALELGEQILAGEVGD